MLVSESNIVSHVGCSSFNKVHSIGLTPERIERIGIIEKIFELKNSHKTLETKKGVRPLDALAAKSYVEGNSSEISSLLSTLHSVSEFIENTALPKETATALRMELFNQLRGVSLIRSLDLCTDIIFARIKGGDSCDVVAQESGIKTDGENFRHIQIIAEKIVAQGADVGTHDEVFKHLQIILAEIHVEQRVMNGESCLIVAQEVGIKTDSEAFESLQMIAAESYAGQLVREGESCLTVAQRAGIKTDSKAFESLQMIAAESYAGQLVREGESCLTVAQKAGIKTDSKPFEMLQRIAIDSHAGQLVREGESCLTVAQEVGINTDSEKFETLQMIAVNYYAGQLVRDGESPLKVAQRAGIKTDNNKAFECLQIFAVRNYAGQLVRDGESPLKVAQKVGINIDSEAFGILLMIKAERDTESCEVVAQDSGIETNGAQIIEKQHAAQRVSNDEPINAVEKAQRTFSFYNPMNILRWLFGFPVRH